MLGVDLLPQSIAMEMAVFFATWVFLVSGDILWVNTEEYQRIAVPRKSRTVLNLFHLFNSNLGEIIGDNFH